MEKVLTEHNERWKKFFESKRLPLVYEISTTLLDFLANIRFVDAKIEKDEYPIDLGNLETSETVHDYTLVIESNGNHFQFNQYELYDPNFGFILSEWAMNGKRDDIMGYSGDSFATIFEISAVEECKIQQIFKDFEFVLLFHDIEIKQTNDKFHRFKFKYENMKVQEVITDGFSFYFLMENGDKIYVKD